jgi:hypothetical protein
VSILFAMDDGSSADTSLPVSVVIKDMAYPCSAFDILNLREIQAHWDDQ